MMHNMGGLDRIIRLLVAAFFAVLLIAGVVHGVLAVILAVVAVIFVITSIVGYCPLYGPLHVSTVCKEKPKQE